MTGEKMKPAALFRTLGRRKVIARIAITFSSWVVSSKVRGGTQSHARNETPSTAADSKRTSLQQEVDFKPTPQRIYEALLDSKQFATLPGMSAEIDPKAGGAFSTLGGLIVGRNIELIPNQRIVQAWRPTHRDTGIYSIVKFELKPQGAETRIVLDHTGFPEGEY
jgi:activator of HSP90 ATPase